MHKGIYQAKDGKWFISVKVKINGSYHTCTIRGFDTKKEADEKYDYEIEKWRMHHHYFANDTMYEVAVKEFLDYRGKQVRKESLRKEKTQFHSYWDNIFMGQPLTSVFVQKRLKIIYQDLERNTNLNQNKKSLLVRVFLDFTNFCYLTKRIPNEVCEDVKIIMQPFKMSKIVQNEKRYIPDSDLFKLFEVIDHTSKDYVEFKLFAYLGCRISEFLGLCVDSFDKDTNRIKIKRQLLTDGTLTATLKTANSYREIPINSEIAEMLNIYIVNNNLKEGRLFRGSHTDFKRKLRYYEAKAGIPLYATHEYRHTKCFNLAKKCQNISDVVYCAKIMGHSVSVFENTYCNHLDNSLEQKFI